MLRTCHYTLDRDGIVSDVSDTAHLALKHAEGRRLLDAFHGLDQHLQPLLDKAWRNGCASRMIFFAGTLAHVAANRADDTLTVTCQELPIDGLRESLLEAEAWIADHRLVA